MARAARAQPGHGVRYGGQAGHQVRAHSERVVNVLQSADVNTWKQLAMHPVLPHRQAGGGCCRRAPANKPRAKGATPRTLASFRTGSIAKSNTMSPDSAAQGAFGPVRRAAGGFQAALRGRRPKGEEARAWRA